MKKKIQPLHSSDSVRASDPMCSPRVRRARVRRGRAGFSLIEVVIALGIIATVMVSLLGLFGYGSDAMREATNTAISARISQTIIVDLQAVDPTKILTLERQRYYYNGEGTRVRSPREAVYVAKVDVIPSNQDQVTLPGLQGNSSLTKVNVKIGRFPGGSNPVFRKKDEGSVWEQFTTIVVDMTKTNTDLQ